MSATLDKAITLSVLDESELKNGEMKQVDFGEGENKGKVLLSKVEGKIYATSAHCTHYGAPLAKGVLDSTGRVVCPWHGACLNVKTGDVEDSPGLDGLHTYVAEVKDGKIFVTANLKAITSKTGRSPIARAKNKKNKSAGEPASSIAAPDHDTTNEKVVIVGGGPGGLNVIEALREHGFDGKITLISKEPYVPFDRTKLSKALISDPAKLAWRTEEELIKDYKVDLQLGTEVKKIDTQAKEVETSKGEKVIYDKLVLAPGSTTKKLPIDGVDLEGVVTLRTLDDVKAITSQITEETRVAIIGTSFIGLELAGSIAGKKPKSVNVIGMDKVPFASILGPDIGEAIQKNLEGQGVKFHMEIGVEKILPADKDSNRVGYVALKDADPIPADLLILGVGVAPATGFLEASGFKLEKDKGVKVDEYLRVEGQGEDIFAIGDIAHYPQAPGKPVRRVEHWNVASNHGRSVAESIIAPKQLKAFTKVPIFWSSAGGGLRYVSSANGFDEVHIVGDLSKELKFVAYYAQGDEIVAVASIKSDPYVSKSAELIRLKQMPTFTEIKAGKDILEIDISGKIGN